MLFNINAIATKILNFKGIWKENRIFPTIELHQFNVSAAITTPIGMLVVVPFYKVDGL